MIFKHYSSYLFMKTLVTGGAGFIGSHLVDALIKNNHHVIIVDSLIDGHMENLRATLDSSFCNFLQKDIRDSDFMLNELDPVDIIYHLAADPDVRNSVSKPLNSYDHNMNGTINILEYMRKHVIQKMVFASSGGTVYGDVNQFPMTEELKLCPISPYGASKAAAEMYLSAYSHTYQMKIVSVRFANIFGERSQHGVGFDFYNKLKKDSKQLTILGDGTQQKSYLHVSDAIDAIIRVGKSLDVQEKPYEYYNVGSEEWYTVDEIAAIYEELLGLNNVTHEYSGGKRGWVGDVNKMLLSIEKIKKLGYEACVPFKDGVQLYIEWLAKQKI